MLILAIVFSVFAIGFFCWLLFTLAVYALPVFVGLTAAFAAYHSGYGMLASALIAIATGGATLAFGQIAFALVRTPLLRVAIAMLFAVPAAIAGYDATLGIAHIGLAPGATSQILAAIGAVLVGGTAWSRMALYSQPDTGGNVADHSVQPRLSSTAGSRDASPVLSSTWVDRARRMRSVALDRASLLPFRVCSQIAGQNVCGAASTSVLGWRADDTDPFLRRRFSFFAFWTGPLARGAERQAWVLPRMQLGAADHTTSLWRNRAEDRLRLDRLSRNVGGSTFLPWASPIPREARKSSAFILRCAPARKTGASSIVLGLPTAIEAAMVAGSHTARRTTMASIGTFKKTGKGYEGEIVTLSVQAKGVRIVPETNRTNEDAPTHRVFVGRAEIGAAWAKRSEQGRDYLSLKLDDPSFNAPIYTNLFDDEDGETASLIWSRGRRKQNGD